MRGILDKFGKLTQKQSESQNNEPSRLYCRSPVPSSPITATKAVQTDFPVAMLESYVVKNKKQILALLNIPHSAFPYNTEDKIPSTGGSLTSPGPKSKDNEKSPLLKVNSAKLLSVVNDDPDPDYGIFRSGKRCSEGEIARQTCLVPLLSNGTSF